jgi:hypothetical protein
MTPITITDSEGNVAAGHLPRSWADVGLAHYTTLAQATTWPTRCRALATICGLPAEPLLADSSLCLPILNGAPFLLHGPLPAATELPPLSFHHAGTTYVPAPADLHKIDGDQLEAILNFLREHEGNVLACAPALLAVLYKPADKRPLFGKPVPVVLTAEVVDASTRAFGSLPMAVAWPLVGNFLMRSASTAQTIQKSFALQAVAEELLSALETLSTPSARSGSSWSFVPWLLSRWTRRARKMLETSSPRSAFTGPQPSSNGSPLPNAR